MTYKYGQIDQHDCLYNTARAYPGGVEALSHRMGISANVFYKKLSPLQKSNTTSFEDATVVMELCCGAGVPDALSALDAMAFRLGKICIDIPAADVDLDAEEIQRIVFKAMAQFGEAVAASTEALADGHLTEQEVHLIEPKIRAMLPTIVAWLHRIKAKSKADTGNLLKKIMRTQKEVA